MWVKSLHFLISISLSHTHGFGYVLLWFCWRDCRYYKILKNEEYQDFVSQIGEKVYEYDYDHYYCVIGAKQRW